MQELALSLGLLPPAQVHLAMVRYHEAGRFCEKDEQWDQESAVFHVERAALCGELEAIVALGQCYLQLPHHILPDVEVEVTCSFFRFLFNCSASLVLTLCSCVLTFVTCRQDNAGNRMKGFKYLLQAAEAGDRSSMIIVARAFDTGIGLSADRSVKSSLLTNPGPTVVIILPSSGISGFSFYYRIQHCSSIHA